MTLQTRINKEFKYSVKIIEQNHGCLVGDKNKITIIKGKYCVSLDVLNKVCERLQIKYPNYKFTVDPCRYDASVAEWLPPIFANSNELNLHKHHQ